MLLKLHDFNEDFTANYLTISTLKSAKFFDIYGNKITPISVKIILDDFLTITDNEKAAKKSQEVAAYSINILTIALIIINIL